MKERIPTNAKLIPSNAQRVFKGKIFDVYQWQQEMYDGTKSTFEMLKRPDTVEVIAIKDGKVVVLEEEQPNSPNSYYALPGGRHDVPGESTLQGAKRELLEETGLTFKNWRLVGVIQPFFKCEWFIYFYLATDLVDEQPHRPDSGGERINVMTKSVAEIKTMLKGDKKGHLPAEFFDQLNTVEDILELPEFKGQEVDR